MKPILAGLVLALAVLVGSCTVPPNSLSDHPYRHLPTGPIGSTGGG